MLRGARAVQSSSPINADTEGALSGFVMFRLSDIVGKFKIMSPIPYFIKVSRVFQHRSVYFCGSTKAKKQVLPLGLCSLSTFCISWLQSA